MVSRGDPIVINPGREEGRLFEDESLKIIESVLQGKKGRKGEREISLFKYHAGRKNFQQGLPPPLWGGRKDTNVQESKEEEKQGGMTEKIFASCRPI